MSGDRKIVRLITSAGEDLGAFYLPAGLQFARIGMRVFMRGGIGADYCEIEIAEAKPVPDKEDADDGP